MPRPQQVVTPHFFLHCVAVGGTGGPAEGPPKFFPKFSLSMCSHIVLPSPRACGRHWGPTEGPLIFVFP